ncbi:MAG: bifunctional UDP-N-acetylmuramoyl-tripeptide:D-alanyl-D-alanine ligase/alanine racemase [Bacteroidetes bacterium]|nr:bifunctional UDP-N-acetylmuramoyl-tripeptide:D-alanyl-D-alanine ligase/alanine racemase [Bacteroidota bacterium]
MLYTIKQLVEIFKGELLVPFYEQVEIANILLDSRKISFPDTSLFFAVKGKRHDGHNYISEVYEAGVRNFVISKRVSTDQFPGSNFLLVKDTITALQDLAAYHRKKVPLKTIGITGSNGKTIVKEWLHELLREDYTIVKSPKSYNSQVGVALSLLQIEKQHDLGIFEAGISTYGEMERLAAMIRCDIGLFTNIGEAHSEGFSNLEEKIQEKLRLFESASTVIYCKDDKRVEPILQKQLSKKKIFTWSKKEKADLQIVHLEKTGKNQALIKGVFKNQPISITVPFTDDAYVENTIHCWASMLLLGYDNHIIKKRMFRLTPVAMRLELKEGINQCLLINDSYNSDLTSLNIALNFLEQQSKLSRHTLVLSDILQSGLRPEVLYEKVAQLIQNKNVNHLIAIGEDVMILQKYLPKGFSATYHPSTTAFLKEFSTTQFQKEAILLKGARPFHFEKIAERLSRRVHRTTLEVNLDALVHNLHCYNRFLHPSTKMAVMIKASAYGSGSVEVAKVLEYHNVEYLAVAYADEGVELRKAGIQLPVLVLNTEEATFSILFQYQLEPEIYSLPLLRQFLQYLPSRDTSVNIHLKLETGMHRLGFEKEDFDELLFLLKTYPQVKVKSIFSHLAASEAQEHDTYTNGQLQTYLKYYRYLSSRLGYQPLRHILNSSGIVRFSQYQLDMVRLGIGIYGIDSSGIIQQRLKTVNTFKATISQIKSLDKGETAGYSRLGRASQAMRIATISVGYADGLPRSAGNGNYELSILNHKAPIVGNVCMDMCMVDVTNIPQVQEGDEVIVFGKNHRVEGLAESTGTIPYEIFTGISQRVKRIYTQE